MQILGFKMKNAAGISVLDGNSAGTVDDSLLILLFSNLDFLDLDLDFWDLNFSDLNFRDLDFSDLGILVFELYRPKKGGSMEKAYYREN